MTAEKTRRVRSAATLAALPLIPLAAGYGIAHNFHLGEWMMTFGLVALVALILVALIDGVTLGDRDVG